MIRQESVDLEGTQFVLESAADLPRLKPPVARLVSRRVRDLFADPPRALRAMAALAELRPLARWLRRNAQKTRYALEIYVPGEKFAAVMAPEVYLSLHRTDEEHPILISGGLARVPKTLPPSLREVLTLTGVIRHQWNCAGVLLPPSQQVSLPTLLEENASMWCGPDEPVDVPPRPNDYRAYYLRSTGAYLMTTPRGETWACPHVGGHSAGPAIDAWLTAYFDRGPWNEARDAR
jgi:hypothetical protein